MHANLVFGAHIKTDKKKGKLMRKNVIATVVGVMAIGLCAQAGNKWCTTLEYADACETENVACKKSSTPDNLCADGLSTCATSPTGTVQKEEWTGTCKKLGPLTWCSTSGQSSKTTVPKKC